MKTVWIVVKGRWEESEMLRGFVEEDKAISWVKTSYQEFSDLTLEGDVRHFRGKSRGDWITIEPVQVVGI